LRWTCDGAILAGISTSPTDYWDSTAGDRHPSPTEYKRVFVSYSRRDFYFAEQLAVALRRHQLDAWFDVHELRTGTDWSAAIDRAIVECDTLVFVASRSALASPYVQRERERAAQLQRPQVAVLRERVTLPSDWRIPVYDLTNSFSRGVEHLAADIAAGCLTHWRPRIRLPLPGGALLVASAPALCLVFTAVLTVLFLHTVIGNTVIGNVLRMLPHGRGFMAVTVGLIAIVGSAAVYDLWSFLRRRISWRWLRGGLLVLPIMALQALVGVNGAADPLMIGIGVRSDEPPLGPIPTVLALLVVLICIVAAIATSFSAGLCRYLPTGVAPRRVRSRHIGGVPQPVNRRRVVRSYRLLAADVDAGVAAEIRRFLADAGLDEVTDGRPGDRDLVVLTDASPAGWLSREDLRHPIAIVATSIPVRLRRALGRFQWVDYRRRLYPTLRAMTRDLTAFGGLDAAGRLVPDVPEGLQQFRLPRWVAVLEWTLFSSAALAAMVGAYVLTLLAFEGRQAFAQQVFAWPTAFCLVIAPFPVLLALWLRRRRVTLRVLVGAVAGWWLAVIVLGLDPVLQKMAPPYDLGSYSALTMIYAALSAVILALAWRSARRWLPRRLRSGVQTEPVLGSVRGSWLWIWLFISAALISVSTSFTP
jgi:hypothetical protein